MADETKTAAGLLLPETGAADVGILEATGTNDTSINEIDDGIVENNQDDSAASNNNDGIQKLEDDNSSDEDEDMDDDDDEEEEEEEEDGPTTRWDVFQALQQVTIPGNFCAGGCADGSTTITPSLPTTLGLRVTSGKSKSKASSSASSSTTSSIGTISLPVTDAHVQHLRTMSSKVDDESYHNVRQVDPECIKITNPSWESSLTKLLRAASLKLGVNPGHVRADLDMMMLFQRGSCVDRCHKSINGDDNVLGTLMIQLPSIFTCTGGEIQISEYGQDQAFDLGSEAANSDHLPICHYLCYYVDCGFEMKEVTSGSRLMISYSLIYEGIGRKPKAVLRNLGMLSLERSLKQLPRSERIFAIPLGKLYSSSSLQDKGIDALEDEHRSEVETIRAASGKSGWELMIISATRTEDWQVDDYCYQREPELFTCLTSVVTEVGAKCLESKRSWLQALLKLSACTSPDGMILSQEDYYDCPLGKIWGAPRTEFRTETRTNYDCPIMHDDDEYGGFIEFECELEEFETKNYESSFVLAYDPDCEFELKCLSGKKYYSADIAALEIVQTKDFSLLQRLVILLDSKPHARKISFGSSSKLIELLIGEDGSSLGEERASLVVGVVKNTFTWPEPSQEFYRSMGHAVDCVGWSHLSEMITTRMQICDRHGLVLSQFLVRTGFLLGLRSSKTVPEPIVQGFMDNCVNGFNDSRRRTRLVDASISSNVMTLIDRFGWTPLIESVVKVTIDVLREALEEVDQQTNMETMIIFAEVLIKLESMGQASTTSFHLGGVIKRFVTSLQEEKVARYGCLKFPFNQSTCSRIIAALRLILHHGDKTDCISFGSWIASDEKGFYFLLDKLSLELDNGLSSGFLNKCMIGCTAGGKNPVIQIDAIVRKFPGITQTVDTDGRLSLHHAVASGYVCRTTAHLLFEAHPNGVSTIDPITGLHPFMLASVNNNLDVAFKLLVADPSLVGGALRKEAKKRKRSSSMS